MGGRLVLRFLFGVGVDDTAMANDSDAHARADANSEPKQAVRDN